MNGFWQKHRMGIIVAAFVLSVVLAIGYVHIYTNVFGLELPKTVILKKTNERLKSRASLLEKELDSYSASLTALEIRDEDVYRSIFGLKSISKSEREAGLTGDKRYDYLSLADRSGGFRSVREKADMLAKKAFVQTRSYDEIELMLSSAGDMATSIPAIFPIVPDDKTYRMTSPFGFREHPVYGGSTLHTGMDFATKIGNPVFATGDGVVDEIRVEMRGYGRQVIINHGFGYKTRYAHLNTVLVTEGMKVKRGDQIGQTGNTGLTSGPHLHYEVIYKGEYVNPRNYYDSDISLEQYNEMVRPVAKGNEFYIHPSHRRK